MRTLGSDCNGWSKGDEGEGAWRPDALNGTNTGGAALGISTVGESWAAALEVETVVDGRKAHSLRSRS